MSRSLEYSEDDTVGATLADVDVFDFEEGDGDNIGRGTGVGRFLVLATLGAGAMGVVYAAYDPKLDRKVALKLLRDARGSEVGRQRLLREAQALARLSHPNVVAIYDVGTHQGQVWIAMEFVEGQTLSAWLDECERSWREILALMLQAGEGLAAAHAKGLVHRDFKPDNVMIGDDGRVRVMDFGLARTPVGEDSEASGPILEPSIEALIDKTMLDAESSELTAAGVIMGTPRYMSAEQWSGGIADARSDQFAFCLTLWESIYGGRAFPGHNVAALSRSVKAGLLNDAPRRSDLPNKLRKVIERGMLVDGSKRWPSMDALLDALGEEPQRRRGWILAPLALSAVLGVSYGAVAIDAAQGERACTQKGESLAEQLWTSEQRARVGEAVVASGLSYAEEARPRVLARIDSYVEQWAEARTRLCRERELEDNLSPELHELALECLDEGRDGVAELVEILGTEADRELLSRAVTLAAGLPLLERCEDRAWLARRVRPPQEPGARETAAKLRRRLRRVHALESAAKLELARTEAEAVLAEAEAFGWAPLTASARVGLGAVLGASGEHEASAELLEQALYEGASAGDDEIAAYAAKALAYRVGVSLARHEQGLRYAKLAEAFIARAGAEGQLIEGGLRVRRGALLQRMGQLDDSLVEYDRGREVLERVLGSDHPDLAGLHANLGVVHYLAGDYPAALAAYGRAEQLQREVFGPHYPGLARTWSNIGVVHFVEGRYGQALGYYKQSLAVMEAALGPDHIDLAILLNNVGMTHYEAGEDEQAVAHYERALAIRERTFGKDHPDVADSLNNLAQARESLGLPLEEVQAMHERALAIIEASFGTDHPRYAGSLVNLGLVALEQGEYLRARELYEQARDITAAKLGEEHPHMGVSLISLADVDVELGELERARSNYERGKAICEAAYGTEEHPEVASAMRGLARVHELQGRPEEARPLLERALAIREQAGPRPRALADLRFPLARVVWALDERPRALELAAQAQAGYAAARRQAQRTEVEAWIAAHPLVEAD